MNKIETYYQEIIRGLNKGFVDLKCPVAYHRGKMVLFTECADDKGHIFGGGIPKITNQPPNSRLQTLLNISTSACDLFNHLDINNLPLIFPFQHDGGAIQYTVQSDSEIKINSLDPAEFAVDWPYEHYPECFGKKYFCNSDSFDITESNFEKILPQGLWKEDANEMVVVVPPSTEYGVSLWGEMGDDEGVMCVFYINPKTKAVRATNQCD